MRVSNLHRSGRTRALLVLLLAVLSGLLIADGLWIKAKAELAQVLIERAWQKTLDGEERVRPWPWADTWPVAALTVEGSDEKLIVLAGAHGRSMPFGPGHISQTAAPNAPGNCALAAHRDTHFRFLRGLKPGDVVTLSTPGVQKRYRVYDTLVLDEKDTWVIGDAGRDQLTLVTCWPFDAVIPGGPGRYAVLAEKVTPEQIAQAAGP